MKRLVLFIFVLIAVVGMSVSYSSPPPDFVADDVIVVMNSKVPVAALRSLGYRDVKIARETVAALKTRPGQTMEGAIAELTSRGDVLYAQPNFVYRSEAVIPNDPRYSTSYHHGLIGSPNAWEYSRGSSSETVAILDSGIDTTEIEFSGRILSGNGIDIVDGDDDSFDSIGGHGSAVAAVAMANTNNGVSVSGIDWAGRILPIRVLDEQGYGSSLTLEAGIRSAIAHGAGTINLSLSFSGDYFDQFVEAAIKDAAAAGILIVASAGNSGTTPTGYPASSIHTIAAGASNSSDARASFSSWGAPSGRNGIDLLAPGAGIRTIWPGLGDVVVSGTSFSAPVISGAVSVLRGMRPGLMPEEIRHFLRATAKDIGAVGFDEETGAGRLDFEKLLRVAGKAPDYGDSLASNSGLTGTLSSGTGRLGSSGLHLDALDEYAAYNGEHYTKGSISYYWRPEALPGNDTLFVMTQRGNESRNHGHVDLLYRDGKLVYSIEGGSVISGATKLNVGQWYHIAVSYGDTGMRLYVNGELEGSHSSTTSIAVSDTLYLGAPAYLGAAVSAFGVYSNIQFATAEAPHSPSALQLKLETPAAAKTTAKVAVSWKAFQTETAPIVLDIYADADRSGYNGVLLASGLTDDQSEIVSLAGLTDGEDYYLYGVARSGGQAAWSYAPSIITYQVDGSSGESSGTESEGAAEPTSGSSGGDGGGGCILSAWSLDLDLERLRSLRDGSMDSQAGRLLVRVYYKVFGR